MNGILTCKNHNLSIFRTILALLLIAGACSPGVAQAVIVYTSASSGANNGLPIDGTAGALTIVKPAGTVAGQALIASIAARPSGMTVTVPPNWFLMTSTQQLNGGVSTAPGGMNLLTYYHIVGTTEPVSYTWTFANPSNQGGSAVGGILAFSGIDTSGGNPIDGGGSVWSAKCTGATGATPCINGSSPTLTHGTNSITTVSANTMIVSSISFLSASSFANPTGSILTFTERLDQSAPAAANAVGTTIQMSTAPMAAIGATGTSTAVATGSDSDSGIGHLMALKPSVLDLSILMTRSGPLSPGGSASYTMTVTNNGINSEPGPISVVDTLPVGVSYASVSGAGWACSIAGQVVTCTRAGALAAGASATALVLNVNVSVGASGVQTNTATVSGTGGDGNTANNTAVDTYIIPTTPYAYYAMDETSWGTIADSSGNGRNASVLGVATATGNPPPNPPNAAISGNPGTCGVGKIPSGITAIGVNTGIDVNSIGNAGTIMFWYNSNTAWNDGNSRMLFDASLDQVTDKHFFLAKTGAGALTFALEDTADLDSTATSPSYTYAANQWHHIAVTWDLGADSLAIYLDGNTTPIATSNTNVNGILGDMATLYLGAQRMANVTGTPAGYTTNTANGYIDEVRIYQGALSALEIASLATTTHACATSVHHYELSLPTSSITCLPTTATVTACADSSSPCTNPLAAVNGQTAQLTTTGGTFPPGPATTTMTVTFGAIGVANTTLSYPAAADGTTVSVTLSGEQSAATNPRKCCPDGVSCVAANSCSSTFNTAGFIFSASTNGVVATIPTQVAGTPSVTYYLRAVKTNTTTMACQAALTGAQSVNFAYECNNPTTCYAANLMSVNGGAATTVARNNNGSVASYTPVSMTFDANGNAPFTFNYSDVGQVKLYASKAAGGSLLSALTGSSNAFVVKPGGFVLSNIKQTAAPNLANPAAANAAGAKFVKAGEAFTTTVTATTSGGVATPNFGKETTPESVKLTSALVTGLGLTNNPSTNGVFGAFSNGVATADGVTFLPDGVTRSTPFTWNEVGIITLTPSILSANYLGVAGDSTGTTTGNVGRFYAAKFALSGGVIANRTDIAACVTSGCGSFTYMGERFDAKFTLTAQAVGGATTQNYSYSATPANNFAKLDPTATANPLVFGALDNAATRTPLTARLDTSLSATGSFGAGVATVAAPLAITRSAAADGPYAALDIGIAPVDGDGAAMAAYDLDTTNVVSTTPDHTKAARTEVRYGRIKISNAHGSELLQLPIAVTAQYWNGLNYVTSTTDSATSLNATTVTSINWTNLTPGNWQKLSAASTWAAGATSVVPATASVVFVNGVSSFKLAAPGAGKTGSVDITTNSPAYLLDNTTTRATFGVYKGANEFIYLRENY